jgi:hypothetical protein
MKFSKFEKSMALGIFLQWILLRLGFTADAFFG